MPRRKYDTEQRAALKLVEEIHSEEIQEKAALRRKLEEEYANGLTLIRLKKSRAANEARSKKIAKSDIGRAIGTSNWATINDLLALTEADKKVEDFTETVERFTLRRHGEDPFLILTVNVTGQDWDDFLTDLPGHTKWRKGSPAQTYNQFRVWDLEKPLGLIDPFDNTTALQIDHAVTYWAKFGPGATEIHNYLTDAYPALIETEQDAAAA